METKNTRNTGTNLMEAKINSNTKQVVYIDPPSGWEFGFPKVLPDDVEDVDAWLIENGYPAELIEHWADSDSGMPCNMFFGEEQ